MEPIAKAEGAHCFVEVNLKPGAAAWINSGGYQGWFTGPNYGSPHGSEMAARVKSRIATEIRAFGRDTTNHPRDC